MDCAHKRQKTAVKESQTNAPQRNNDVTEREVNAVPIAMHAQIWHNARNTMHAQIWHDLQHTNDRKKNLYQTYD